MNAIKQTFDTAYTSRAPVFGAEEAELVTNTAAMLPEGSRVLDLGCGDGRNSLFLLEHGFQVQAVDFAESGVAYLQRQAEERGLSDGLTAEIADIRDLEFDKEEFDAIVSITVLENLTKQEQLTLMDRVRMACRTGGVMTIECHSDRDPAANGSGRATEFGDTIIGPIKRNELLGYFSGWRILQYYDIIFEDTSHGAPNDHGRVGIIAQNTKELTSPVA
jgi:tellurite methyltransferase